MYHPKERNVGVTMSIKIQLTGRNFRDVNPYFVIDNIVASKKVTIESPNLRYFILATKASSDVVVAIDQCLATM